MSERDITYHDWVPAASRDLVDDNIREPLHAKYEEVQGERVTLADSPRGFERASNPTIQ